MLLKTILITNNTTEDSDQYRNTRLFLIGIPASKKLDFRKLSKALKLPRSTLSMATYSQVEDISGFSVGSIPPFGHPKNIPVILDNSLEALNEVWCGTGKTTESLRLTVSELKELCTPTFADLAI